jgi:putative oxidoreductase
MFRNLFNPGNYSQKINFILLLLRLTIGIFMLTHGSGKFVKLVMEDPVIFSDPLGVGIRTSLSLAVFAEVICSILIILGLATRLAPIPIIVTMLVAIFIVHMNDPFRKKELPGLYSVLCLSVAIAGAGKYSIDYYIFNRRRRV